MLSTMVCDDVADSCTNNNGLIRVNALVGLTTEDVLDLWHTRHTADKDGFLDAAGLQPGITRSLLARVNSTLDERVGRGFELGTEQLEVDVLGVRSIHANERQVDLGLSGGRKPDLGPLGGLMNTLVSPGRMTLVSSLNSARMCLARTMLKSSPLR